MQQQKANRYRLSEEDILACCAEEIAWAFGRLCCKAEKIHITQMTRLWILSGKLNGATGHAVTLSIGERERESYERFLRREQTVIYCVMKLPMIRIIVNCIRRACRYRIENSVFVI